MNEYEELLEPLGSSVESAPDEEAEILKPEIIVEMESGAMVGYVKILRSPEPKLAVTKDDIMTALADSGIIYGIKESAVEKFSARPIYGIKIEVARGLFPVDGEDGTVDYFVKTDAEYKPEIANEGTIDYKSLEYFQMVKEGQMLCAITLETEGIPGMNLLGREIPARKGRPVISPQGKNTSFNAEGTVLFADCDGIVKFTRSVVDVNDNMRIPGNVDVSTGNVDFSGDVTIDGDVCDGFSVKAGGNIVVKGVVEGAAIQAGGNVQIANGINGAGMNVRISVGGDLRCKYIEHAIIDVEGSIVSDYIIDSYVTCKGDIALTSGRGVLIGGETTVLGRLTAKEIGTEREKPTKIEVMGIDVVDTGRMEILQVEREDAAVNLKHLREAYKRFYDPFEAKAKGPLQDQLRSMSEQIEILQGRIEEINGELLAIKSSWKVVYDGSVCCRRLLYQGVKINFGETKFQFSDDSLSNCMIYWDEGNVLQSGMGRQ